MEIRSLDKPAGKWCDHCAIGSGCKIYEERPQDCRDFHCGYLRLPDKEVDVGVVGEDETLQYTQISGGANPVYDVYKVKIKDHSDYEGE